MPDIVARGMAATAADVAEQAKVLAEALSLIGKNLSGWNCTTGLATTFPESIPYTYENGAYFLISEVASEGGTNYRPSGTQYTGTASTTVESATVQPLDMYRYNGNGTWELLKVGNLLNSYVGTMEQSFTDSQKAQARTNIGAIALEEYDSSATPVDGVLYYVSE